MMEIFVYIYGKQYQSVGELAEAVTDAVLVIYKRVIRNLYYSIPLRLVNVIGRKVCMIMYWTAVVAVSIRFNTM